jgi:hypothetical protein
MAKKKYKVVERTNKGKHVYYESYSYDMCLAHYCELLKNGKCSDRCGIE